MRKFIFRLLTCLWLLVIVAISGELAFRAMGMLQSTEQPQHDPIRSSKTLYKPHPYLRYTLKENATLDEGDLHISINAQGFRGETVPLEKDATVTRILCLGGTTTFGIGGDESAWPYHLKQALQTRYPERTFEIINAAVPGYYLIDSLDNYQLRYRKYQPDLVILYQGMRDIYDFSFPDRPADLSHYKRYPLSQTQTPSGLARYSKLLSFIKKQFAKDTPSAAPHRTPLLALDLAKPQVQEHSQRIIRHLKALVDAEQCPLLVTNIPLSYDSKQTEKSQIKNAGQWPFKSPTLAELAWLHTMVRAYNDGLQAFAAKSKLAFCELAVSMSAVKENFVNSCQLSNEGAHMAAEKIATSIQSYELIK